MTSKQKLLFVAILGLALFFRFYLIGQMPGGLFPDEAANGLDIVSMERGDLQPFYERGNGREALFFYMQWASVEVFGKGAWQHHIVSAFVGLVATIITFFLTRRLALLADDNKDETRATWIALLAMFLMAVSSWHVVLSRTAFRANLIPLFATLTFYLLIVTAQAKTLKLRLLFAALTGASFALGIYTYIAYRILVPVLGLVVLWPMLVDLIIRPRFEGIKKFFAPAVVAGAAFAVFIAPIAYYFYTHAGSFIGRSGQVSVFNPELNGGDLYGTMAEVFRLSMKAYFWSGDLNWRHNISGEPFLSIIISPFFAIGLAMATYFASRYTFNPSRFKNKWTYFLLAGWFWSMILPVITTAEGIPHGLRAIGTIPPVFILAAFGLFAIKERAEAIGAPYMLQIEVWKQKLIRNAVMVMYVVFVLALISQTYFLYFVYAANSPENFYAFRSDLTVVSNYLKESGDKNNTYLILDKFSIQTVEYITTHDANNPNDPKNQPYIQVDPEDSWKLTGLKPGDRLVFTQSSIFDIRKFKQYHPEAKLFREDRNKFNQTVMAIYVIQ